MACATSARPIGLPRGGVPPHGGPVGVGSLLTIAERDFDRVRPGLYCYILVGVLGLVALVRYGGEVHPSSVAAWLYLGALLWFVVSRLTGLTLSAWLRDPSRPGRTMGR